MLFLSENDLKNFFGEVVRNVAKEMNIKDWEWYGYSELLELIESQNKVVYQKLEAFFDAYKKWHEFHAKVEQVWKFVSRRKPRTGISYFKTRFIER
jgi:hypothetical protein